MKALPYTLLVALLFASALQPVNAQTSVYASASAEEAEDATLDFWDRHHDWSRPLLFDTRLPYAYTGVNDHLAPIRYNRVDGLVVGFRARELEADDWEWAKPVGQVGYAFALGQWRYDAGLEVRPFAASHRLTGTRLGLRYRFNTISGDSWKAPSVENTLAAFFFRNDFYDYYEAQGWSVYLTQPLHRRVQVSVGYRAEDHRALGNETSWSIFGDGRFRPNPMIAEGHARSVVAALDAGRVRHRYGRPIGSSFRVEYEVASDGLGSELSYSRLFADVRTYGKVWKHTAYAARMAGGFAEEGAVLHKQFGVGGVGTVRGYPMNAIRADRMVLLNAEYGLTDVDFLLKHVDLYGFADVAWTSGDWTGTRNDETLASVGIGTGLAGRKLRLELAFPLNDVGFGMEPSLWFRLYPQF